MILLLLLLAGVFFFSSISFQFIPNLNIYNVILRGVIVLCIMAVYMFVGIYMWHHIITEISLENDMLTFTYLNNKKETISVYDVIKIKIYSSAYLLKTHKKEYSVAVKFNFASMKHEKIEFIEQEYFPNAKFLDGLF